MAAKMAAKKRILTTTVIRAKIGYTVMFRFGLCLIMQIYKIISMLKCYLLQHSVLFTKR
jgi:hypothetical protein